MKDIFLFLLLPAVSSQVAVLSEDDEKEQVLAILTAIDRLGHGTFQEREMAGKELIAFGEPALPFLNDAIKKNDPEISFRASILIRAILRNSRFSRSSGIDFSLIQAGEFEMGSPDGEQDRKKGEEAHTVQITKSFILGKKEVSQEEFFKVMGFQPSEYHVGLLEPKVRKFNTEDFPVESVTWYDAILFCNRLSEKEKLPPYYSITEIEKEGKTTVKARVELVGGIGYRLPTEAEWEYACRAGSTTPYHFGKSGKGGNFKYMKSIGYGSTQESALGRTAKRGSYKPNGFGLYDMHGNVAEWCWDWYSQSYYSRSPKVDPPGPQSGVLSYKVQRGGSYLVKQSSCRSGTRFYAVPRTKNGYTGFRVARDLSKFAIEALKHQKQ